MISTLTNLENFGYRELALVIELLTLYSEYKIPESFIKQEVTIMFNHCSGMVFLTNADYQVLMVYNGNLELFHTTPYKGIEGFKEELKEMITNQQITHPQNIEFILFLENNL